MQPSFIVIGTPRCGVEQIATKARAPRPLLWPLARVLRAAFTYEAWNFGIARVEPRALLAQGNVGPVRWARLPPLFGLRADPVLWDCDGELRVLYEELDHYRGYAEIRSVAVADLERGAEPRRELAPPFHVSYPLLLRHDGELYGTLESAIDRGVDLYRWNSRLRRWDAPRRILSGVPLLDPTPVQWRGGWYLFGTRLDGDGEHELQLFSAPALTGPWREHPASPYRVPEGTARCGGAFFECDGRLYRPAQVADGGYGAALAIKRVDRLDARHYAETEVTRLLPDPAGPWPEGLHTVSLHDGLAVIDGKCRRWHPLAWLSKVLWRLRGAHRARLKRAV